MFIGRDSELARVSALVDDARRGASHVLVVTGEPGIGKTTLLARALSDVDALVLATRGTEIESGIPYVGLGDIFSTVADSLDSLPPRQAQALSGALALGPSASGDRFAVASATLQLLSTLAERRPVVVAVDDTQWVDRFSVEALAFTARRLRAEGVLMLFAIREGDFAASGLEGFEVLRIRGLDDAASRQLVRVSGSSLSPGVVRRLIADTAGNPLALMELPSLIDRAYFTDANRSAEPLPVSELLTKAFSTSIRHLPAATQAAMLLLAVFEAAPQQTLSTALDRSGINPVAFEPAELAGLVIDRRGRPGFRHPLVRAVVYHGSSAARRRVAHQLAADLLASSEGPDSLEQRVWHLFVGGGEVDAALLERLHAEAEQKMAEHRYAGAAHLYSRAAQLSPAGDAKSTRLLQAANATRLAGRIDDAAELLGQLVTTTTNPRLRVEAEFNRFRLDIWRGQATRGRDGLLALSAAVEPSNPVAAAAMLGDVSIASVELGQLSVAAQAAERASRLIEAAGVDGTPIDIIRAFVLVLTGHKKAGREILRRREPEWDTWDPLSRELVDQLMLVAGLCHFALGEDSGRVLLTRAVAAARNSEAVGVLRSRLGHLAWMEFTAGNWHHSLALAHETLVLAQESGGSNVTPMALANLARIEAALGREQECRRHAAAAAEYVERTGTLPYAAYADYGLGLLAFGRRDLDTAVQHLESAARRATEIGLADTPLLPWRSLLAEIYARRGQTEDAARLLETLEDGLRELAEPVVAGIVERCRALLRPEHFEEHLPRAIARHEEASVPFELARTQLQYGEHLRRAGRRVEARTWLEAARLGFEALGAADWITQAGHELRSTGIRVQPRAPSGAAQLTPQEVQVALAVAGGLTNREVAGQLFLSVKTVEFHLGNVYRKLGVGRRSQLAGLLARQPADMAALN